MTPAQIDRARQMLEDGAGYTETARTTGHSVKTLRKYLPGKGMSAREAGQLGREIRRHRAAAGDLVGSRRY
jgi:DNA invertase Pin-like site-specific DNA recombinase